MYRLDLLTFSNQNWLLLFVKFLFEVETAFFNAIMAVASRIRVLIEMIMCMLKDANSGRSFGRKLVVQLHISSTDYLFEH